MTQTSLKKGKKEIYECQGQSSKDEVSRLKKKAQALKKKQKSKIYAEGHKKWVSRTWAKTWQGL